MTRGVVSGKGRDGLRVLGHFVLYWSSTAVAAADKGPTRRGDSEDELKLQEIRRERFSRD